MITSSVVAALLATLPSAENAGFPVPTTIDSSIPQMRVDEEGIVTTVGNDPFALCIGLNVCGCSGGNCTGCT